MSSTQMRITPFHDEQRDIPNLEFSPSHAIMGFSQIPYPIIVLPKDDRTDSAQEERLFLLTFVRFHAEIFSNFSHSLSIAAFAAGISIA